MPYLTETLESKLIDIKNIIHYPKKTKDLEDKVDLLPSYTNYNFKFYKPTYFLTYLNENYIIFGEDLSGYFCFREIDGKIFYAYSPDKNVKILFCNSNIKLFVSFYNVFLNQVVTNYSVDKEFDPEQINLFYNEIDFDAMKNEEYYWVIKINELEEGFFPLNDERVSFYKSL